VELVHEAEAALERARSEIDGTIVVLGSRGLHGLAALGSVTERVAHEASGSVLVVR
jgi:nucleotide-binding universal stress UspA family protein